jgi:hypothetical protein
LKRILKSPGTCLVLMAWWIIAFFMIDLFRFHVRGYLSSYVPYLVAFIVLFSFGIAMNILEVKLQFWSRLGHWGKLVVLTVSYALAVHVMVFLTLTLYSYGLVGFFGADPEGSFGMLYLPSVAFYFVVAAVVGVTWTIKRILTKRRLKPPNLTNE